eukprot:m.39310 g.39310  ORF g.39310 m.39310 type:complete len:222 (-) comp13636_c0_seq1:98-763(-)
MFVFTVMIGGSLEGVVLSIVAFFIFNSTMGGTLGGWGIAVGSWVLAAFAALLMLGRFIVPATVLDQAVTWIDEVIQARAPDPLPEFFRANPLGDLFDPTYTARRNRARAEVGLDKLHTEPYRTAEQLMALSARQLRDLAKRRGVAIVPGPVEKSELVGQLHLTDPCSICLDTWSEPTNNGQLATFLKCGHIFHSDCIKQWVETAGQLGPRRVSCPYCNTAI